MSSQKKGKEKKETTEEQPAPSRSWIPMRTGIAIIAIVSVGMAVLTAIQVVPQKGLVSGILYGVLFGVMIWVVFFGLQLFYRFMGR
jgi:hypothetical protein